jgi:IS4 transposase
MQAVIDQMPVEFPALIPGYPTRIIDGNHLPASEHRLKELRTLASGPLPGQSLVVFDPDRKLVLDVYLSEDGHEQERSLLLDVVDHLQPGEVWIGDRNFCTTMFLWEVQQSQAFYLIRQHATNVRWEPRGERRRVGRVETGMVYEQQVTLHDGFGNTLTARRITIALDEPTEDGETEVHLLTNLPKRVDARTLARAYRERWTVEQCFWEVEGVLHSELRTLAYPKAALFAFCVALVAYNLLRVVQTALASVHGLDKVQREVSSYYLADETRGMWRGLAIAVPDSFWKENYACLTPKQLAKRLVSLAGRVKLSAFRKHRRGPKKPAPKRKSARHRPHIATARILSQR